MSTYTITDTITGQSVTCATYDVADAIRGWFPEAPADVAEAIENLQDALLRGAYEGDYAEYLAVRVEG